MDISPDKNADIAPTARATGDTVSANDPLASSMISSMAEPIIMGIDSKNEKFAASDFSTPCRVSADIVAPLRDTPGSTAIPCKTPVKMLFLVLRSVVSVGLKF